LQEGEFVDGCVVCPWHHSRFRLDDGSIVDGPAVAPQPTYAVREQDGTFSVRRG
jgi:nitrite reductase/ring-hydroxylating ferredoxin subunit